MSFFVPKASLLPAAILVTVVGFTFATLRSYGPESTVRKLHTVVKNVYDQQQAGKGVSMGQWNELKSIILEDPGQPLDNQSGDQNARRIVQGLYSEFSGAARYSLAKMDRFPREVRVAVVYTKPSGQYPIVYVVEKTAGGREWRINAAKTMQANF